MDVEFKVEHNVAPTREPGHVSDKTRLGDGSVAVSSAGASDAVFDVFDDVDELMNEPACAPVPDALVPDALVPDALVPDALAIHDLEARLADREHLVEILTERLEQAADELDRIKRSGGTNISAATSGSDGAIAAMLAENQSVAGDLKRFHEAWEERYEGPSLRRIERSLDELKDALHDLTSGAESGSHGFASVDHDAVSHDGRDSSAGSMSLSAILGAVSGGGSAVDGDDADSEEAGHQPSRGVTRGHRDPVRLILLHAEDADDGDRVHLPTAVDLEEATREELVDAVERRDQYAVWLSRQVRSLAVDLQSWMQELQQDGDFADFHDRLAELGGLIHRQLQTAEVELSIERARIAREQITLAAEAEQLRRAREELERGGSQESSKESRLVQRMKRMLRPE